jgi:cell division protein FtsI (penicillin-binding protein 3)
MQLTNTPLPRITSISILIAIVVATLMGGGLYKVVVLKVSPPTELTDVAVSVNSSSKELARRGKLLDRKNRILAASRLGYSLFVDPKEVKNPSELSLDLGEKLSISPATIEEAIRSRPNSRYVVLVPLLTETQLEIARELSYRGIGLTEHLVREYPHGEIGATLIGFVGTEHSGLAGFEDQFDKALTGESGLFSRQRDSKRRTLWVSPDQYTPRSDGKDVQLSIDIVIQKIATQRLQEEILRCNAGGGRIVVADPTTGEILGMADLLNQREGWSQQPNDPNREINPRLGRNRCVTDPYEPGSTFKPFVWSAATELGYANVEEILPTPSSQPYRTPFGRVIRDAHYYGPSSWEKVLVKSMNSGMAIVSLRLSHEELQDAVQRFGFGEPTRIGLGGETAGIVTKPNNWNDYTQTSVSMGHEIAVTPLQMVQGFCAFARDGTIPRLLLTPAKKNDVIVVGRAISSNTAEITREILGRVMTEGTGRRAKSDLYDLFGKSGTAQLPREDGKGYFEDRYISSFIAGAPLDAPKLIVLCVIDDPDRSIDHYGGVVAGPVVRDVLEESLQYLGVSPTPEYFTDASE